MGKHYWRCIRFASNALLANRRFVLTAIMRANDANVLQHVSEKLRGDPMVVRAAMGIRSPSLLRGDGLGEKRRWYDTSRSVLNGRQVCRALALSSAELRGTRTRRKKSRVCVCVLCVCIYRATAKR